MIDIKISEADIYQAAAAIPCRSCHAHAGQPCQFRGSGLPLPEGVHLYRWNDYAAQQTKEGRT